MLENIRLILWYGMLDMKKNVCNIIYAYTYVSFYYLDVF